MTKPRNNRCVNAASPWLIGLAVLWSAAAAAQDFRIIGIQVDPQGNLRVRHESSSSAYFILYRGDTVTDIRVRRGMALGSAAAGELSDLAPGPATAFYRIKRVPLAQPLDTDGDGLDDVFELGRAGVLNPRDPTDALTQIRETSPVHEELEVARTRETSKSQERNV